MKRFWIYLNNLRLSWIVTRQHKRLEKLTEKWKSLEGCGLDKKLTKW